jgi:hypothetical protein
MLSMAGDGHSLRPHPISPNLPGTAYRFVRAGRPATRGAKRTPYLNRIRTRRVFDVALGMRLPASSPLCSAWI